MRPCASSKRAVAMGIFAYCVGGLHCKGMLLGLPKIRPKLGHHVRGLDSNLSRSFLRCDSRLGSGLWRGNAGLVADAGEPSAGEPSAGVVGSNVARAAAKSAMTAHVESAASIPGHGSSHLEDGGLLKRGRGGYSTESQTSGRLANDMGFEMSVVGALKNFWRHVGETYRAQRDGQGQRGGWRYMATLVRSQRSVLLASIATLVLAATCEVTVPFYASRALNSAAFAKDPLEFGRSWRRMLLFKLMSSVFTGLRGACFWLAGTHVVAKVRYDLLASLLNKDIAFHDENETGALTSRLSADTTKISSVVSFHVNILCRQVIQCLGGLGYLFSVNPQLASVALGGLLLVGTFTAVYGRFTRRIAIKAQAALAEAGSVAQQSLSLVRVIRAHANEGHERRRYGRKIGHAVQLQETQGIGYGLSRMVIGCSQALLLGGVLLRGAGMVFEGTLSGEKLTTFVFYTNFVVTASFDVGDQWSKIQEALGAGQYVFELIEKKSGAKDLTPETSGGDNTGNAGEVDPFASIAVNGDQGIEAAASQNATHNTARVVAATSRSIVPSGDVGAVSPRNHASSDGDKGRVEFRDLSFRYPTRPGVTVLQDMSFMVRPGERVAVVGASGGGKSTILRLICRFYNPERGVILLGGRDISTYDTHEISRKISWVTQEPQLFPVSVRENIAYGLEEGSFSMEDIERAAMAANIHSFVHGLPDGYDTAVGESGASLSGGQKQRVAIARALIRDPEVLLLDEPTSALDVESERLVQEALDRASEGRSVILIAHRLATIQRADRIFVIKDGRVVESGKHPDLLALGGIYTGLYKQGERSTTLG